MLYMVDRISRGLQLPATKDGDYRRAMRNVSSENNDVRLSMKLGFAAILSYIDALP